MDNDWIIQYDNNPRLRCYATKAYLLIIVKGFNNNLIMLYDLPETKSYNILDFPQSVILELLYLERINEFSSFKYWTTEQSIMCELEWDVHP